MPQDSLRSVVYRSFVTCDDPKGVVECKTVRKPKIGSQKMENKLKNQRMQPNSNTSSSSEKEREDRVSRGYTEDLHNLSSFQVMEVSKGAQKLNEVIDSLSNRTSFSQQSKYIAKDLLKGALDLQESLLMLGKLQETSRYIAKSKKKQKEKTEIMDFIQCEENDQEMDFQKPRTSVASSRDCYEELREVIKESFARQNLLPKATAGEKDFVGRNNNLEFCVDAPSSSSSQSSLIHSYSSNSSPLKVRNEKSKGPNLIAKLMGLEEVTPSKPANSRIYKQEENTKLSRHLIDIDLPRPRKPQFEVQKSARERRTLEDIIETMQFKGLPEKKPVDRYNDDEDHSDTSYFEKGIAIENPPIVIMRPRHFPQNQTKVFHANYYVNEQRPTTIRQMPRKLRKELPFDPLDVPRGRCKLREMHEKFPVGRKQNLTKECKISGGSLAGPLKKTTDVQNNSPFVKIKRSKAPSLRVQKKETMVKVIDSVPKVAPSTRKQAEVGPSNSRESIKPQNQNETINLKLSRPARGSNVSKCQIVRGKTTPTDKHMIAASSLKSTVLKKNLKKDKADNKLFATSVDNTPDNNLVIDHARSIHGSSMKSTISEQSPKEVPDASYNPPSVTSGNDASSEESSEPTVEYAESIEDGSFVAYCDPDEIKDSTRITSIRNILLCSASFLSRAEELFDTTCDTTVSPTARSPDSELPDDFVLQECAKEILERKSQCCIRTMLSLSQNLFKKPKCHRSLAQLVQEISDGIEYLRSYNKSYENIIVVDSIYSMLEKDLWWKAEVTGAWDLGWRKGLLSVEEVDEVVNGVEMLVLSDMVDDMVREFTFG